MTVAQLADTLYDSHPPAMRVTAEDYHWRLQRLPTATDALDAWLQDVFGDGWQDLCIVRLFVREGPATTAVCERWTGTGWDTTVYTVDAPRPFPLHAWLGFA